MGSQLKKKKKKKGCGLGIPMGSVKHEQSGGNKGPRVNTYAKGQRHPAPAKYCPCEVQERRKLGISTRDLHNDFM